MGKNRTNNFRSAVRHLKSKQIDERLEVLNERPANSTTGLYTIEPGSTTEPEVSDLDLEPDFTQDDSATDTTGLFAADGTILTVEPPLTDASPDRSYILGPMASMWYSWGNFTQIGYVRESDRKMVNLGRITGELQNWDKQNGFTSYGQLTLEQAVWFCNTPKYQNGYANYRAFYPGPPSNTPDEFGRYYCTITGTPKSFRVDPSPTVTPPSQGDSNAAGFPWGLFGGNSNNKKKRPGSSGPGGDGSGGEGGPGDGPGDGDGDGDGPPDDIIDPNTGEPRENATPEELAKFAGYLQGLAGKAMAGTLTPSEQKIFDMHQSDSVFSPVIANEYERIETLKNKAPGTHTPQEAQTLRNAGLDDFVSGGNTQSPLGDLAMLGLTFAGVKTAIAGGLSALGTALGLGSIAAQAPSFVGDANNSSDYNKQLAAKIPASILSGQPQEIKLSDAAAQNQVNSLDPSAVEQYLTIGGEAHQPSAQTTVNPTQGNKGSLFGNSGWGAQGGSEIHYNPTNDTLTITSEKTLRTTSGGNTVTTDDTGKITNFSDIPTPPQERVQQISSELLKDPAIDAVLGGLGNVYKDATGLGSNPWDMIKNDPTAKAKFEKNLSQAANGIATDGVQGTASNVVAIRAALTNLGLPKSEIENLGGAFGQVYSQTNYSGDQIPANIRNVITNKPGTTKESYKPKRLMRKTNKVEIKEQTSREKRKRILREVKQPYVLPEAKKEKYKFKKADKVRAKLGRTINPDMMKQAECPTSFKQPEDRMWGKYEKERNAKASQDKKNVVLDHLGGTDHVLEYILETGREKGNKIVYGNFGSKAPKKVVRKEQLKGDNILFIADENGRKETILQSEINDRLDQEHSKELFAMYVEPNKPLYEKLKERITE